MDIWSLGCPIQSVALGINPTMTRSTFAAKFGQQYGRCPAPEDDEGWYVGSLRQHIPTMYRPLDFPAENLECQWASGKMPDEYHPLSATLNGWYYPMFHTDPKKRITADALKLFVVPLIESQITIAREEDMAAESAAKARVLRAEVVGRAAKKDRFAVEGKMARKPSYEGSNYGCCPYIVIHNIT
jgi:hypothetical protein